MQLRTARLCLDCDEVHDAYRCPACTSETFAYLTRWVPEPERHQRPGPTTSAEAEVFRKLLGDEEDAAPGVGRRMLKHSVVGLAALGLLGWFWRGRDSEPGSETAKAPATKAPMDRAK